MDLNTYIMIVFLIMSYGVFHCPKSSLCSACSSLHHPQPLSNADLLTIPSFTFFRTSSSLDPTECSFFRLGLSLSNMHLRFLHVFSCLGSSFLFSTKQYSILWMRSNVSLHLLSSILVASKFGN